MPIVYEIDRNKRRVVSSGTGVLSLEEAKGHMNRLANDPAFHPSFSQLIDFRGITKVTLSHEDVYELSTRQVFLPDSKRAFVTANTEQFGLARMFQSYRSAKGERGIRVFSSYEEAVTWLDPEGPAAPVPASDEGRIEGVARPPA